MSDYHRHTYLPVREVLKQAEDILTERAGLRRTRDGSHSVTYSGPEGTVTLDAHRHGAYTEVVAQTNQLRTSKVDNVVRFLLNRLPYQPGDEPPEPEQVGN